MRLLREEIMGQGPQPDRAVREGRKAGRKLRRDGHGARLGEGEGGVKDGLIRFGGRPFPDARSQKQGAAPPGSRGLPVSGSEKGLHGLRLGEPVGPRPTHHRRNRSCFQAIVSAVGPEIRDGQQLGIRVEEGVAQREPGLGSRARPRQWRARRPEGGGEIAGAGEAVARHLGQRPPQDGLDARPGRNATRREWERRAVHDPREQARVLGRWRDVVQAGQQQIVESHKRILLGGRDVDLRTMRTPVMDAEKGRLPTGGNAALMLTRDAERQEGAWKFIAFATFSRGQELMTRGTGYVPCKTIPASDERHLGGFYRENPLFRPAMEQMPIAQAWYAFPGTNGVRITEQFVNNIARIVEGNAKADAALADIATSVRRLLPR